MASHLALFWNGLFTQIFSRFGGFCVLGGSCSMCFTLENLSCNFSRNFFVATPLALNCSQSPIFPYDGRDQRLCVTVSHLGWVSNLLRGLWTVHIKLRWPLVPMSTRSWRCNEKTGACEQSPLTQNITTIQTSHGQRGAFPSAARDCTFLCAVKKVRYNSRRGEILVNTFPFLFTLTGVSQCTGTIWQTGRIKIWPMRRELLDKKYPLYGGRVSRVPPWLMLCGNTKF